VVGEKGTFEIDVLRARLTVRARVSPEAIMSAALLSGMRLQLVSASGSERAPPAEDSRRRLLTVLAAVSGTLLAAGFVVEVAGGAPLVAHLAHGVAALLGLWLVLPRAVAAARHLRPDMNLLMTVAVAGAIGLGDWREAGTVAFLFATSLALESWSAARARRGIAGLLDMSPSLARVRADDGSEVSVRPERVTVGATFVVHPGERIPLDGKVLAGHSAVDESPITGESMPAVKGPGSQLFAGTINGEGQLEAQNLRAAQDTTLARLVRAVEEAQGRRGEVERWVDRFAAIYTPVVIALAAAVLLGPPLAVGADWSAWIYRSLVLLVIACPCALVISTPVTVACGIASAARGGVLVKGGEVLEVVARLRAVAFDKTGTLTRGRPVVERVVSLNGHSEAQILARAAALESRSMHPFARAILASAATLGVRPVPAGDVRSVPGKGVSGVIEGRHYWLGSHRYLEERGGETPEAHSLARKLAEGGRSVVVVGSEAHVCGMIALADGIRPEALGALGGLRRAGVTRLVMLTGDNRVTAERIAASLGIDEVRSELLPEQKLAAVDGLVGLHGTVAMVGDGVNDAPAMARASVGIAMGAAGSDAAIETADVALMADDLAKIPWLVGHARRMLAIVHWNIALALGVKAVFALLALLGFATLWGAIAADMGASLLVVFNGMRLLRPGGPAAGEAHGTPATAERGT
jgi:Cd2+/Zn2+-exporting ATPase